MFSRATGAISPIYREWAAELNRHGYVFLLVDSFRPRKADELCSIQGFDLELYRTRPKDAYGALWYLQAQPFVRGDRIGLIGWSQGGGATLFSIGNHSLGRPERLPQGDFRAAVAFYPGSCNIERQSSDWASRIPLLVLMGAEDVWPPLAEMLRRRGSQLVVFVPYPRSRWPVLPGVRMVPWDTRTSPAEVTRAVGRILGGPRGRS